MALEHIADTAVEALDPAICPGGLWGCEAVPDVEGCTELIELMLTGGGPLAQAEQAICERFAVVCEDSADMDGAGPFQVAQEAAGIDCGLCIEDADKDPAGGPVYCHKEVATPVLICRSGRIFHVHMEVSGLAGLEAAVPGLVNGSFFVQVDPSTDRADAVDPHRRTA